MTPTSQGKHSPARLDTYLDVHDTRMHRFVVEQFVLSNGLEITSIPGALWMEGEIECLGGLRIEVQKRIGVISGGGPDALVKTELYRYNVSLQGRGVIFRYDSPHPDHRQVHHKHSYDVLNGDTDGTVNVIYDEEDVPTLGEVIEEARNWYYAHQERLK